MKPMTRGRLLAMVGLALFLLTAWGLDVWLTQAQAEAERSFAVGAAVETAVLANLVLAFLGLGLAWLVLVKIRPGRPMAFLYIAIGGLIAVAPVLTVNGSLPNAMTIFTNLEPTSYVNLSGAFVTAVGVRLLVNGNVKRDA